MKKWISALLAIAVCLGLAACGAGKQAAESDGSRDSITLTVVTSYGGDDGNRGSFVAAVDLYKVFTEIGTSNYEYLVPYLAMALIYIILVLLITLLFKIIEKYMRRSDRT